MVVALVIAFAPVFPYRPYRLLNPNDGWTPCDKWLTSDHCDRLEALLQDYGERYIRAGQRRVLITLKLKLDRELTGNYSMKAEPGWTKTYMDNIINGKGEPPSSFE